MKPWRRLLLAGALLISGCGGSDRPPVAAATEEGPFVVGRVFAEEPVEGAPVRVLGDGGAVLATGTTRAGGAFELALSEPARSLTVVAEADAGTHYAARLEDFDAASGLVLVNAATTLAWAYRSVHPELHQAEADERVRGFLGMPAGASLATDATNRYYGFDHFVFERRARALGSFDALIAQQASAVDASPKDGDEDSVFSSDSDDSESDVSSDIEQAAEDDLSESASEEAEEAAEDGFSLSGAGSSLLSGLGKGALSYLGQAAVSWAFTEAGIPVGSGPQLAAIEHELQVIKAELNQIEGTLGKILQAIETSLLSSLSSTLDGTTAFIDTTMLLIEPDPKTGHDIRSVTPATLKGNVQNILARPEMLLDVENALLGLNGTIGMIALLREQNGDNLRFLNSDSLARMQSQLRFYQTYQLRALNLLLEACHQQSPPDLASAETFLDQFHLSAKKQQQRIPQYTAFSQLGLLMLRNRPARATDFGRNQARYRVPGFAGATERPPAPEACSVSSRTGRRVGGRRGVRYREQLQAVGLRADDEGSAGINLQLHEHLRGCKPPLLEDH